MLGVVDLARLPLAAAATRQRARDVSVQLMQALIARGRGMSPEKIAALLAPPAPAHILIADDGDEQEQKRVENMREFAQKVFGGQINLSACCAPQSEPVAPAMSTADPFAEEEDDEEPMPPPASAPPAQASDNEEEEDLFSFNDDKKNGHAGTKRPKPSETVVICDDDDDDATSVRSRDLEHVHEPIDMVEEGIDESLILQTTTGGRPKRQRRETDAGRAYRMVQEFIQTWDPKRNPQMRGLPAPLHAYATQAYIDRQTGMEEGGGKRSAKRARMQCESPSSPPSTGKRPAAAAVPRAPASASDLNDVLQWACARVNALPVEYDETRCAHAMQAWHTFVCGGGGDKCPQFLASIAIELHKRVSGAPADRAPDHVKLLFYECFRQFVVGCVCALVRAVGAFDAAPATHPLRTVVQQWERAIATPERNNQHAARWVQALLGTVVQVDVEDERVRAALEQLVTTRFAGGHALLNTFKLRKQGHKKWVAGAPPAARDALMMAVHNTPFAYAAWTQTGLETSETRWEATLMVPTRDDGRVLHALLLAAQAPLAIAAANIDLMMSAQRFPVIPLHAKVHNQKVAFMRNVMQRVERADDSKQIAESVMRAYCTLLDGDARARCRVLNASTRALSE